MMTIYVFCNQCAQRDWHSIVALGADGRGVAGHVCSSHGFAQHDMGFTSDWKHDRYDAAYGAGNWQLEYVETVPGQPITHAGLLAAIEASKARCPAAGETA